MAKRILIPEEVREGLNKVFLKQGFPGGDSELVTDGVDLVESFRFGRFP